MSLYCFHIYAYQTSNLFLFYFSLCCASFYVALFFSYPSKLLLLSFVFNSTLLYLSLLKREFNQANHVALKFEIKSNVSEFVAALWRQVAVCSLQVLLASSFTRMWNVSHQDILLWYVHVNKKTFWRRGRYRGINYMILFAVGSGECEAYVYLVPLLCEFDKFEFSRAEG